MSTGGGGLASLSIRQLKSILEAGGVSYAGLTEKSEFVKKVEELRKNAPSSSARSGGARSSTNSSSRSGPRSSPRPPPSSGPPPSSRRFTGPPPSDPVGKEIHRIHNVDDYYQILGCSKGASEDELKKAYRKLAMKLHPDKCKQDGADEAFKKVGNAFACLSDADKRAHYDRWGAEQPAGSRGPGGAGFRTDIDAEEMFRAFFGGHGGSRGGNRSSGSRGHQGGQQVVDFSGIVERVVSTFASNPWTILIALTMMSSLMSLATTIMAQPYLLLLPVLCPAQYRMQAGMIFLMLLMYGFF